MASGKARVGEQAAAVAAAVAPEREGAEIVTGAEACCQHSAELLGELGFPRGVLPLRELVECGLVRATGFVWMRQRVPSEHFFPGTGSRVSYAAEVTAYVERGRMKRVTGVRSRQMMMWVPIVEMSLVEDAAGGRRIYFRTPLGLGKSFPVTAFMEEEEKQRYLQEKKEEKEITVK